MGHAAAKPTFTAADYLAWEATQPERHDFVDGEVFAMAGAEDGQAAAGDDGSDSGDVEWLIVASETNDAALIDAMVAAFRLTVREAEVLQWVARGKTNRDIGEILGASPRTITKHMEHILPKLGVETRTAAAGLVLTRIPGFSQSRG